MATTAPPLPRTLSCPPSAARPSFRLSEARQPCVSIRDDQVSAMAQGLTQQTVPFSFHHHLYHFTFTTIYLASYRHDTH